MNWTTLLYGLLIALATVATGAGVPLVQDHIRRRRQEADKKPNSDAAIWRRVKSALDELMIQIELLAPGMKPAPDGTGLMYSSIVDSPGEEWAKAIGRVSRECAVHAFYDPESNKVMQDLLVAAKKMAVNAGNAAWLRSLHTPAELKAAIESNQEAVAAINDFRKLYERTKEIIRDSVGYDRLYGENGVESSD